MLLGILAALPVRAALAYALSVRRRLMEWVWRIPALGEHLRIIQLARFYRSLGMLLIGGIPIMSALNTVSGCWRRATAKMQGRPNDRPGPADFAAWTDRLSTPLRCACCAWATQRPDGRNDEHCGLLR